MSQHCSLSPNPSMNFARTSWRSWRCTALCCLFLVNVVFFCYGCLCFVGLCWSLYCSSCFIALSAKCIPFEVAQRHARKPTGACPWPLNRKTKWSAFSGTFKVWRKPDSPPTNCSLSICLSVCLSIYLSISFSCKRSNMVQHIFTQNQAQQNYVVLLLSFCCAPHRCKSAPRSSCKAAKFCACGQLAFQAEGFLYPIIFNQIHENKSGQNTFLRLWSCRNVHEAGPRMSKDV